MIDENLYLAHHGVKGQKWGVRKYQNEDGSLTDAGKKRYLKSDGTLNAKYHQERLRDLDKRLQASVRNKGNLNYTYGYYKQKAIRAKVKGNYKKYDKFSKRAESAGEHYKNEVKQQMQLGNDFINALKNVEESGYAWKAKPTLDMNSKRTQNGKNYIKENGRLALKVPYNGATGNKFTVKENASQRKKDIYTSKHMIKPYAPATFM